MDWIKEAFFDIQSGLVDSNRPLSFFNYDGKRGETTFVFPSSVKFHDLILKYKQVPGLIHEPLSSVISDLGEFVCFSGLQQGIKKYLIITKENQVGFSGYPRFFIPKAFIGHKFFDQIYRSLANSAYQIMQSNYIRGFEECYYDKNYIFREIMDIDFVNVDFMCDFPQTCLLNPFTLENCRAQKNNVLHLLCPNTKSFNEERNKNDRTNKWVLQCASKKWKALRVSDGRYIVSVENSGSHLGLNTFPGFVIMPCIFESESGRAYISKILEVIKNTLSLNNLSLDLVDIDSRELLKYFLY